MCNNCCPRADLCRPTGHNGNHIPLAASSQQWQTLEFLQTPNRGMTATRTQTCQHHTQTQSQSLFPVRSQPYESHIYDLDAFHQPCNIAFLRSNRREYHNHHNTFESLLQDLLNHAIINSDTTRDCTACQNLVCYSSSQQQQCNTCATDHQQLASLLLNLIDRVNTTTQSHNHTRTCTCTHNRRTPTHCCSHDYSSSTNTTTNGHQHQSQRTRCPCQSRCETCITTHEQTKTFFEVLFRITRRRTSTSILTSNRSRGQCRDIQAFNRSQRCSHTRVTTNTSNINNSDLCRLIRRLLDEIENEATTFCTCQTTECQEYVGGNVRRLRKVIREIERDCDGAVMEDMGGCRCGVAECYEMERTTTTTFEEPERRRRRAGNFHIGWVL